MSRPPTITDDQFIEAYTSSPSARYCAIKLGVSVPTVYYWINKLGLRSFKAKDATSPNDYVSSRRGIVAAMSTHRTVGEIAAERGVSPAHIRKELREAVEIVWGKDAPPLPRPRHPWQIRVVNYLYDVRAQKRRDTWNDGIQDIKKGIGGLSASAEDTLFDYLKQLRARKSRAKGRS